MHQHRLGYVSTIFIDDTLLMGDSGEECVENVATSVAIFENFGFVVHPVGAGSFTQNHVFGL